MASLPAPIIRNWSSNQGRTYIMFRYLVQGIHCRLPWCKCWEPKIYKNKYIYILHITQYIINQVRLTPNPATRKTPTLATKILRCDNADPKFDDHFHCCGAIEQLNLSPRGACNLEFRTSLTSVCDSTRTQELLMSLQSKIWSNT